MGLQCSILGHSFEPAGVEREREEQGSEVVTTEREIEQCRRCGAERVVSESTEVTTVVEGEAVGLDTETEETPEDEPSGGGITSAVERSDLEGDAVADEERSSPESVDDAMDDPTEDTEDTAVSPPPEEPNTPEPTGPDEQTDSEPADPESEDAEILTDDDGTDREPGQWPGAMESDEEDPETVVEIDEPVEEPQEESLSGITVPEGEIVCPECGFRVDANSGYRAGDPCPECSAWLEAERNQ